jgi:hypothetical protein
MYVLVCLLMQFQLLFSFQVQYILSDGSILVQQKEVKKDSNKNNFRRMIVVNQQDLQQATTTSVPISTTQVPVTQQRVITQQIPSNGNVETKIVASSSQQQQQQGRAQQAMTPLGPLTLTAEEYNELMQRRMQKQVVVEVDSQHRKIQQDVQERVHQEVRIVHHQQQQQQQQQHHQIQLQEHQNLTMQVQKIVQSLEDDEMKKEDEDEDDIEMQLIEPKMETETTVKIEEGTSSDKATKSETENNKNAGRPFTCEQCGKKFLLKHHLTTHARVHSGMQMIFL